MKTLSLTGALSALALPALLLSSARASAEPAPDRAEVVGGSVGAETAKQRPLPAAPPAAAPALPAAGAPAQPAPPEDFLESWRVHQPKKMYVDPGFEPIILFRTVLATTQKDHVKFYDANGKPVELDTTKMDPGFLGYRKGFVLDTVEFGLRGRFEDGFYYQGKFNLVPREKDGNRSSNYLQDAYAGWNRWKVLDLCVGRMKTPISAANLMPVANQAFITAPLVNILIPDRQVGAKLALTDPTETITVIGGMFDSVALASEQITNGDIRWKIVFFHHPAYSACPSHGSTSRVQQNWVPLFEKYGVDLSIAGHDHDYERSFPVRDSQKVDEGSGGVVYVVCGGFYAPGYSQGSDWWTAKSVDGNVSNYVVITIEGGSLHLQAYSGDGSQVLDDYTLAK